MIFLFMAGGVSHVDTFDPKAGVGQARWQALALQAEIPGQPLEVHAIRPSGIPVSELFPQIARYVDDLAIIRSMKAEFPLHPRGNLFLHTGRNIPGRRAWVPGSATAWAATAPTCRATSC